MKKLLSLVLSLALLLGAVPAALADITPEAYYVTARTVVESITGVAPLGTATDPDFEGSMAIMLADGDAESNALIAVIGPDGHYTAWELPGTDTATITRHFIAVLEAWQLFGYDIPGYDFSIVLISDRLSGGSMTITNAADAQTVIDGVKGTNNGTNNNTNNTVQSSRPVVPSILSFAEYRVIQEEKPDEHCYELSGGIKSPAVRNALSEDYVNLLISQYGFTLVEKIDDGYYCRYLLDYTGAGNIRPVAIDNYSADVIVKHYSWEYDEFGFTRTWVYVSPSFDYLETDDRTTVNLR